MGEFAENVESLRGGNVPISLFFDLREDPGLVQGATRDHDTVHVGAGTVRAEGWKGGGRGWKSGEGKGVGRVEKWGRWKSEEVGRREGWEGRKVE